MKLGEALSKLKKEKSRLSRLIQLRKQNIFVEKGKKPKFDPKQLTKEIDTKVEEIRQLKVKILETNLKTRVGGENISLAEAIIKVRDIRSQLAQLASLFEDKRVTLFRTKDEKEMVTTMEETLVEDQIEKCEIQKVQLDNKIQITNWTTQLLD